MLLLFASGAGFELVRRTCLHNLANGDFWWHLRTGIGILETHTLPHSGRFSQSSGHPWIATSWFYEVLVAIGYRVFDLKILFLIAVACKVALAVLVFVLAGGLRGHFWKATVVSAVAQYVLGNLQPLPIYCSVLAFGMELLLILQSRRTGRVRILYGLPILFLFWANLHEQFVMGVLLLLLFAAVSLIEMGTSKVSSRPVIGAVVTSLLATFLTPYGLKPYAVFFSDMTSAANAYFADRLALHFRTPQDYVLLLLTMAAFLALGMRRSRDPLLIGLLVVCGAAAFHAQRDAWMVVLAAATILGYDSSESGLEIRRKSNASQVLSIAAVAFLLLGTIIAVYPAFRRQVIWKEIAETYPVGAADFIRTQRLPQPLFNPFPWGGFLAWYLPEYPVAIDGRTELYGADFNITYAKVMNAEEHYSKFAPLNQAGTILLEKKSLMATALASVPGFRTVYSDDVAIVLVGEQERAP
jgi:hypothetical protein